MRSRLCLFLPLLFLGCEHAAAPPVDVQDDVAFARARIPAQAAAEAVVAGRVLVVLAPGASVDDVASGHGLTLRRAAPHDLFFVLEGQIGAERAMAAAKGVMPNSSRSNLHSMRTSHTDSNTTSSTWLSRSSTNVTTSEKSCVSEVTRLTILPEGCSS